jgi:CubicO group peptidase (beta-lactamase class C family)
VLAARALREGRWPGLAVAVAVDGELVWSQGFGYADVERRRPVDPRRSQFRIGSISKSLTAAGLGVLLDDAAVDLDAPVRRYVPSFPEKRYPLTLRQLGGHLGGMRHYRGLEFMLNRPYATVVDGLAIFAADTLLFEPGSRYNYSTYGFNLLSAAMETAARADFLTFMKKEVFRPLKMRRTKADLADRKFARRVQFYNLADTQLVVAPHVDNSYKWAGGGFLSTAEDLIRFGEAMREGEFLSPETRSVLLTSQTTAAGERTGYGIGFRDHRDEAQRRWFGHSGGSVGGTSYLVVYPEQEVVVVTLVNLSGAQLGELPFAIAQLFLKGDTP